MTPDTLLDRLFQSPEAHSGDDLRKFLKENGPGTPTTASVFDRLVEVALRAGDRLKASAAGHQASIRRLFPDTPDEAITAFCISEEKGPRPAFIFTSLTAAADGFVLEGKKKWGSMSPLADVLYVAASIGEKDGRNQLRMVRVPRASEGIHFDTSGYGDFADHMPIADIGFSNVQVPKDAVIERDAYEHYIKPFRLIEDVYNTAATQIGLFRVGRAHGWKAETLEDLTSLILQAHTISETPMSRPQDVVLMSAYYRASGAFWDGLGDSWAQVPEDVQKLWGAGTGTLGVAARAREVRRQKAWAALA